jgi:hypothetical protein
MPDWGFVALYGALVLVVVAAIVAVVVKSMTSRRNPKFDPPPEN